MTGVKDAIGQQLESGAGALGMFTSDLSDAEVLYQPAKGACHVLWIWGHLAVSQDMAVAGLTGQAPRFGESRKRLFSGETEVVGDAGAYPSRGEAEAMFRDAQEATLAALADFDVGRWEDPSPEGFPRDFFPTVGALWNLLPNHTFWHVGQITVYRRMLNKPFQMSPP